MLESFKNCISCGTIFLKVKSPLCMDCFRKEELKFQEVRDYINDSKNKMASLSEVAEATEVQEKTIVQWIKEGRLIALNNPNLLFPCESCGKPTKSGRLCSSCVSSFRGAFKLDDNGRPIKEEDKNHAYYSTKHKY